MTTTINASPTNGIVQTADGSGVLKVQSNGVTTNALAWVNFNGTTSPGTIRSAYNVSSVTKNATGDYTLNFTVALSDTNYTGTSNAQRFCQVGIVGFTRTTTQVQVQTQNLAGSNADDATIQISFFGN